MPLSLSLCFFENLLFFFARFFYLFMLRKKRCFFCCLLSLSTDKCWNLWRRQNKTNWTKFDLAQTKTSCVCVVCNIFRFFYLYTFTSEMQRLSLFSFRFFFSEKEFSFVCSANSKINKLCKLCREAKILFTKRSINLNPNWHSDNIFSLFYFIICSLNVLLNIKEGWKKI